MCYLPGPEQDRPASALPAPVPVPGLHRDPHAPPCLPPQLPTLPPRHPADPQCLPLMTPSLPAHSVCHTLGQHQHFASGFGPESSLAQHDGDSVKPQAIYPGHVAGIFWKTAVWMGQGNSFPEPCVGPCVVEGMSHYARVLRLWWALPQSAQGPLDTFIASGFSVGVFGPFPLRHTTSMSCEDFGNSWALE